MKNDGIYWNDKIVFVEIIFGKVFSFLLFKKNNDVLVIVKKENSEKMLIMIEV